MFCEKMLIIPYKSEQPGILFQVFLNQFMILYYRAVGLWPRSRILQRETRFTPPISSKGNTD